MCMRYQLMLEILSDVFQVAMASVIACVWISNKYFPILSDLDTISNTSSLNLIFQYLLIKTEQSFSKKILEIL